MQATTHHTPPLVLPVLSRCSAHISTSLCGFLCFNQGDALAIHLEEVVLWPGRLVRLLDHLFAVSRVGHCAPDWLFAPPASALCRVDSFPSFPPFRVLRRQHFRRQHWQTTKKKAGRTTPVPRPCVTKKTNSLKCSDRAVIVTPAHTGRSRAAVQACAAVPRQVHLLRTQNRYIGIASIVKIPHCPQCARCSAMLHRTHAARVMQDLWICGI